jgi:hypothetical protein
MAAEITDTALKYSVFNLSVLNRTFSSKRKQATFPPVFKNGNSAQVTNYRTIWTLDNSSKDSILFFILFYI